MSDFVQKEQVVFRNIYVNTYTLITMKEEAINVKEIKKGCMGGLGGRKRKG